uniref:Uncharacterized protein n=1 Tax=Minutocellus polymorphus TaxID=265543 RepID=A0A7S0AVA6_9STRA|mmetsp:Transcript_4975/g.8484  ORF Transcript_4975/g.8484 Transcript_4975/m.8484 type:complete len:353 (+) Transcript_4975:276-1334(+)|eukprot:CAMPEP_0197733838 /NCGR_PEP_ID=MMETSP1434-20131217/44111_1 /TAXON_ID=265543 /ORGANISM="Minutocellus polymorphus, Strain CCMP3303" /LENGTH=352 /DNA_ID=CAMNT_0043321233 /DNA_START=608 /DNA_END=1666 /DNA_ORIENTATION=-
MSTDMITYLNYIASLENATDDEINDIINERAKFIQMGEDSAGSENCFNAIATVFNNIHSLNKKLEEETISDESVKLAEDAAAVGALFSFGLGMAAFAALAATDVALGAAIKAAEKDLYNALESADDDIANKMSGCCAKYVQLYKSNNAYIKAASPKGMTPQTARSYLYNFMDYISSHGGVGLANFRKYVEVARITKNDPNIEKIYDILDEFTLSGDHGSEAIKKALDNMTNVPLDPAYLSMVRVFSCAIWAQRMKVSSDAIKKAAEESFWPEEEVGVLENMDAIGKFAATITIVVSIADAVLQVYNIVNTVERYNAQEKLFSDSESKYKTYYTNLYKAAKAYAEPKTPSLDQ